MEVASGYNDIYFPKTHNWCVCSKRLNQMISHIDVHPMSKGSRNAQNVQK